MVLFTINLIVQKIYSLVKVELNTAKLLLKWFQETFLCYVQGRLSGLASSNTEQSLQFRIYNTYWKHLFLRKTCLVNFVYGNIKLFTLGMVAQNKIQKKSGLLPKQVSMQNHVLHLVWSAYVLSTAIGTALKIARGS